MSLLFNVLSRFVIAFLPRSNSFFLFCFVLFCFVLFFLISWLQSHFTVILNTPVVYFLKNAFQILLKIFLKEYVLCLVAQSCPALCDPMDCSPPVSSVHGDSPGKNTGMGCHVLLQGISQPRSPTFQVDSLPSEPQ